VLLAEQETSLFVDDASEATAVSDREALIEDASENIVCRIYVLK